MSSFPPQLSALQVQPIDNLHDDDFILNEISRSQLIL